MCVTSEVTSSLALHLQEKVDDPLQTVAQIPSSYSHLKEPLPGGAESIIPSAKLWGQAGGLGSIALTIRCQVNGLSRLSVAQRAIVVPRPNLSPPYSHSRGAG